MSLKQKEPSSGNLIARAGSFRKRIKTNHVYSYTEKESFFLVPTIQHGYF